MRKVEKVLKICRECGVGFLIYPSAFKRRQFCSLSCKGLWQEKNMVGPWRGKKIPFYKRPNRDMRGEKNTRWKGGRRVDKDGYILIWKPLHPHSDYHGYMREHRLIVEKELGRFLEMHEVVHHIDGNKKNNNTQNLKLFSNANDHQKYHYKTGQHHLPPGGKKSLLVSK